MMQNVQDESEQPFAQYGEDKHMVHLTFTPGMDNMPTRPSLDPTVLDGNLDNRNVYTNLQNACKKRKLSQESNALVKSEPDHCASSQLSPSEQFNASVDEEYASSEACLSESQYQCIRFNPFQQSSWHTLCDQNLTEL